MKTKIILFFFYILVNFSVKAQNYVTIPDANFVAWLQANYPDCMNGNQMNIDCAEIVNETDISFVEMSYQSNTITDLTGLEYFVNLTFLDLDNTFFNILPSLSNTITYVKISAGGTGAGITTLPTLPNNVRHLQITYSNISNIPQLPDSLRIFASDNNYSLTSLPELPDSLEQLYFEGSNYLNLPNLPSTLKDLTVLNCQLTSLPTLPANLTHLNCNDNQLNNLPVLPNSLITLGCNNNQLNNLPVLPDSLRVLKCRDNNISCFPIFPTTLGNPFYFDISNNSATCLPNYVAAMDSVTLTTPLCDENDFENNPLGCIEAKGIKGLIFHDSTVNCVFDNSEKLLANFTLKLYNFSDSLIGQTFSTLNGIYQFPQEIGTYKVVIDTLNKPYSIQCQNADTTLIIDAQNPLIDSVNFALSCKPGFDIGTQSVLTNGIVFPGQNHNLKIIAGDLSQWYNMNCASGIGGEVQISVSGPVTYQNPSNEALTPTVSGNVFNYSIPDFGTIDIHNAFGLIFKTDTTAQAGDQICVSINVTATNGDNNMSNNAFEYCYQVINSYDPNIKEVYPINVEPGFEDYFTYTIHFQNTGSAPAFNIRLLDTLDANLDLETFQVINYSHFNKVNVVGNQLNVYFPNIMLADSTSDVEGSKGFVQYRIKPKANLALGTQIKNTAYIYFDFNAPIVTNTTINEYVETVSISEKESSNIHVFPNPFSTSTTIAFKNSLTDADIKLYNVYGQVVRLIADFSGDKLKIERENLANGVYYLKVGNDNRASETVKLILKD